MAETAQTSDQSVISAALIACITMAVVFYAGCTELSENDSLLLVVWVPAILSILTIGYVVTYRTRAGVIFLVIFAVLSFIAFLCYAFIKGMGAAFQH